MSSLSLAKILSVHTATPVVLCLGTPLVSGDSLAVKVGNLLVEMNAPCYVYGTSRYPVTASNAELTYRFIRSRHANSRVLAVDCAISSRFSRGAIVISRVGLRPAAAMGKLLPVVGDASVMGVVGSDANDVFTASNEFIDDLSRRIANAIWHGITLIH